MNGLYKGKYLIVYYDENDYPLVIASSCKEFIDAYCKINKNIDRKNVYSIISRVANGLRPNSRIKLIEAGTITDDCFKEADEDFIKFSKETSSPYRTDKERADKLGISERSLYRRLSCLRRRKRRENNEPKN